MSPQEIQTLNRIDGQIDGELDRLVPAEISTYRRLLIRFVEEACRAGSAPLRCAAESRLGHGSWRRAGLAAITAETRES
jgi:hypothetical protein